MSGLFPSDVFLLVGQSNMAGRGPIEPEDTRAVKGLLVLGGDDRWENRGEPIHFDKPEAGVGLGFAFAKLMRAAQPETTIGLVPCAVGGTSMDEWQPEGKLYCNAVRRAKIAMEGGALKAILWHQGEAECGTEEKASSYAERLGRLIGCFRRDLGQPTVPVVAGELGWFFYERPTAVFARMMNAQINALPERVPNVGVASAEGLIDKGDQLHFDSDSLKELGKRYFEAYRGLEWAVSAG